MTNQEAQEILDEIRPFPRFVRGRRRYVVRRDGLVDIYRLTKSRARAIFELTVEPTSYALPPDVRERLAPPAAAEGR